MYLLDTNVLSEARRGAPEALRWLRSVPADALHISVISIGEIMRGIAAKRRKDQIAADRLMAWLDTLRRDHADRIEIVDDRIAIEWGRLAIVRSRGEADGLLAATAIVRNLTIVTRNTGDFVDLPVPVLNPWDWTSD